MIKNYTSSDLLLRWKTRHHSQPYNTPFRRTPSTQGGARLSHGKNQWWHWQSRQRDSCSWQRDSCSRMRDSYSHEWDSCSGEKVVRFLPKVVQLFRKWYGFPKSGTTFSCISCSRQREQLSQRRDKLIQRWDELTCAHARTPALRAEVFKKNAFTFHNPYVERDCGNLTFHIGFTTPSHLYIGTSMTVPCSTTAVSWTRYGVKCLWKQCETPGGPFHPQSTRKPLIYKHFQKCVKGESNIFD